jgi:cytosine/adenosine deaminase-related metal-dependent hydrolase
MERWRRRDIPPPEVARSPVDYLERTGLLGADLLAIHVVQVDGHDLDVLQENNVAVALCPRSNERHGHGVAPIAELVAKGIRCGLGTDSVASVDTLDLLAEAKAAHEAGLRPEEAVGLLTLGGAEAIGLDGEIGSIATGKWADLCVLDVPLRKGMNAGELARVLLETGSESITDTYVGGRLVYRAEP